MLILVRSKPRPCTVWELAYNAGKFCGLRGYPSSLPFPFSPAALSTAARRRGAAANGWHRLAIVYKAFLICLLAILAGESRMGVACAPPDSLTFVTQFSVVRHG
jgi:hypothetical protein